MFFLGQGLITTFLMRFLFFFLFGLLKDKK